MPRLLLAIFSHRTLALARWDLGLLGARLRGALTGQRAKLRRFVAAREAPVLLNLGAGPRGIEDAHWVNVDGAPDRGVQFLVDFGRPLPFDDGVFDGVFCEHVLEHFTQTDGERLAREVRRILKPGGVLRVIVPDAEFVLRSYFEAPAALAAERSGGEGTAMEAVNAYFRQRYEHQFMYDWPTLSLTLRRAGFGGIRRSCFRDSAGCARLRIDDEKYARESLYVEATAARDGDAPAS
ncbi:MAG TPA: methyltransferase domain-containing protein [Caulobacteraceae bacterium]|nr:methyltransferase domain-containing protein [Caulobacteraceae bacterium]